MQCPIRPHHRSQDLIGPNHRAHHHPAQLLRWLPVQRLQCFEPTIGERSRDSNLLSEAHERAQGAARSPVLRCLFVRR